MTMAEQQTPTEPFDLQAEIDRAREEVAAWPEEWQREAAKTYVLKRPSRAVGTTPKEQP